MCTNVYAYVCVCQLSKKREIKVGSQMEKKSGKIKYSAHKKIPTYGGASIVQNSKSAPAAEFPHDNPYP